MKQKAQTERWHRKRIKRERKEEDKMFAVFAYHVKRKGLDIFKYL